MVVLMPDGRNTYSNRRSRYVAFIGWAYEAWNAAANRWEFIAWTKRPVK